ERVEPPLPQMADLRLHALLEGEVRERLATPEGERLPQGPGALRRSLGPRPLAEALEFDEIELPRARPQQVPGRPPGDRILPEQPPQLWNAGVKRGRSVRT